MDRGGRVVGAAHAQCLSFILYWWLLLTSQVRHEFHSGAKPLQNVLIQGEVALISSKAEKSIWLLETKVHIDFLREKMITHFITK